MSRVSTAPAAPSVSAVTQAEDGAVLAEAVVSETARQAGLIETARAVLWSFFGVRGRTAHERDVARLNPLYVILMGIVLAAAFVIGLISLVRFVVS